MISISDYESHIQSVSLLNLSCFTPTSFLQNYCACSHGTQFCLDSGFFAKPLLLLKCNNHVWEQNEGKVEWTSKGISVIQLRWVLFLDLSFFFEPLYVVKALLIFWVQLRQTLLIKHMIHDNVNRHISNMQIVLQIFSIYYESENLFLEYIILWVDKLWTSNSEFVYFFTPKQCW